LAKNLYANRFSENISSEVTILTTCMIKDNTLNEEILNSIAEGLITVDKTFKINFFNRAAEDITGFSKDEVIGQYCKYVFKCELCQTRCPIGLVLESGDNLYDYLSSIQVKSGSRKFIKLNAAILKSSAEEPIGGVISFRDLSVIEKIIKDSPNSVSFGGVIGRSKAMREIFELIKEVSESDATVLIQGESGTGKEIIANAIQSTSLRKDKPFVKVNCSVFPQDLLASELFGHVKGAFTDASKDRPGRFELADGGTIFLDEVAEMPIQTQVQLLRVLQEGTFDRVGESVTRKADVRVIAATNVNIEKALKDGKLREDLYYRLNVIPLVIPPLRERVEDIPLLVKFFIEEFSKLYKKNLTDITNEALNILLQYQWPGNIRELENVIEYSVIRTRDEDFITAQVLPKILNNSSSGTPLTMDSFQEPATTDLIVLLEKHKWNKSKVAKELGIGRTTLWRKLKLLDK
jgi:PAS domain S-box-containing protein